MSTQLHTQCRSSSASPAGLLRRHRSAGSPTEQSPPWCRGTSSRRHGGGAGRGRWSRPSVSPFERSGSTYKVAPPVGDNRVKDDSGDDNDYWMCDDEDGGGGLSLEEARSSSWLRDFLAQMGKMSPDDLGNPAAAILCPACKAGPGGSLRYRGFQALLDHARSVMAKRVKLHRRFAEILEVELRARRRKQDDISENKAEPPAEGVAGDRTTIPWPPMVVVLNTRLRKQDDSDKWVGMGNRDLLDCFREYEPVKARNAYGSNGHSGASLLSFDGTLLSYLQAQRLHNQFIQEGRGKYQWHKQKPWKLQAAEKRLLYGYMVTKEEELSIFDTYPGSDKHKLKYEMKPYQVMVGNPIREIYDRSLKQVLLEREIAKEIEHYKSLEKTCEQRGQEIEAIRRMLNEQSDEHNQEIESMNECTERLNCKLRKSELLLKKVQEQISSLCSAVGDDGGTATSPTTCPLVNHMNLGDEEHGKLEKEWMDEIAEEQRYMAAASDSGGYKQEDDRAGFISVALATVVQPLKNSISTATMLFSAAFSR